MEQVVTTVSTYFGYFVLLFLRISSLMIASPIFGRKSVPNIAKVGICLVLTYTISLSVPSLYAIECATLIEYVFLCIKELAFGMVLGYVTTVFFSITHVAGYVIDMHMGFGMVNVMDMQNNVSVPITGNMLYVIMMLSFLSVNGLHKLIYVLAATVEQIPVGHVTISTDIAATALEVFVLAFVLAVNVALPVIASGLLGELFMGFVMRVAPQMNMFVVGLPLKVLLGLLILLLIMPAYISFTNAIFERMFDSVVKMTQGLVGA